MDALKDLGQSIRIKLDEVWGHVPTRAALAVAFVAGAMLGCVAG